MTQTGISSYASPVTRLTRTIEESHRGSVALSGTAPGLVQVFSTGQARLSVRALSATPLVIGREGADIELSDDRLSRRHASVALVNGEVHVVDLDSRNGTYVDGVRVEREATAPLPSVLRVGRSLFLLEADVLRFAGVGSMLRDGAVVGPSLSRCWQNIAEAARGGDTVLLSGESGAGKELAARHFHQHGPNPSGPLVAINCATIPEGLAERLLFGTRKGAYSGATDHAGGYLQAAHGGTLFLDEIGELDMAVQPKLLRVLETKEVWPLGASAPVRVDVRICSATLRELRGRVASGAFRQDLYYRIGTTEVKLPALRERREEIPWLIARELSSPSAHAGPEAPIAASCALVESCLLRPWPGNVRELIAELRAAARKGRAADARDLGLEHLAERAGTELTAPSVGSTASSSPPSTSPPPASSAPPPSSEQIEAALAREGGNVSRAARALGLHRNQLRRWLSRREGDASQPPPSGDDLTDERD
jgi:transcriptional regulator of acetoin/glycerol metabolism